MHLDSYWTLHDGTVLCWGSNSNLQLGDASIPGSSRPVAVSSRGVAFVALSAGGSHTCALQAGGAVSCWGANSDGQLGSGLFGEAIAVPVAVVGITDAVAISAGSDHSCAVHASLKARSSGVRGQIF